MKEEKRQGRYGPSSRSTDKDCETSKAAGVLPGIAGIHGDFDNKRIISFYNFPGSFLCLLNNNSGYDILELSFIPGGYNDAGITHIA